MEWNKPANADLTVLEMRSILFIQKKPTSDEYVQKKMPLAHANGK
jgi:hypothetical protein